MGGFKKFLCIVYNKENRIYIKWILINAVLCEICCIHKFHSRLAEEVLNAGTPVVLNAYAMLCDGEISTNIKP